MAKAKAKAKVPHRAAAQNGLPKGFQSVEGTYGTRWDVEEMPKLQGIWGKVRVVPVERKRGGKMVTEDVNVCDVTADDGTRYSVWQSAGLANLFAEAEEGDEVIIEYLGEGEAKKGQNAPKLYRCARRPA